MGRAGRSRSTSNGSWTNSPSSFTYQWQDCNTSGTGCANITGATASTYTLTANEVGDTVRSVVTARNSGGSTPADTAATATVTASGSAQTTNFTCTST